MVSGRAEDKNLVLDAQMEGDIPVVADRRAVKQILVNLLSNAVKFTPDNGKVIVRCRLLENSVRLMIADTGTGSACSRGTLAPASTSRLAPLRRMRAAR